MTKENKPIIKLSKSKIKNGMQCKKSLWLMIHKPKEQYFSPETLKVFKSGNLIGKLSEDVYPEHKKVTSFANVKKIDETKTYLPYKMPIYEASFLHQQTICQADILRPNTDENGNTEWDVIEIKSGTSAKDEYIEDIAIQFHIIKNADIKIKNLYLWHINKNATKMDELFTEVNIEEAIKPYEEKFEKIIDEQLKLIEATEEPVHPIGRHCNEPYECAFKKYCWKSININKPNVLNIPNFRSKWEAFNDGIFEINKENYKILIEKYNAKERFVMSLLNNREYLNIEPISKFINELKFPISSLDFETIQYPYPKFEITPYKQIPFQFSLSVLDEDEHIKKFDYLHQIDTDPRRGFIEELLAVIPAQGSILSYNMQFEISVLKGLATLFPDLKDKIENLISRITDILPILEENYYHPKMKESFSLKSVIPAMLGTENSYENLAIKNGQEAQENYLELIHENDILRRIELNTNMREYCNFDVENIFNILNYLKKKISNGN